MQANMKSISRTAIAGFALAAALALLSAPATSPRSAARPLVTGAAAQMVPPRTIDHANDTWRASRGTGVTIAWTASLQS